MHPACFSATFPSCVCCCTTWAAVPRRCGRWCCRCIWPGPPEVLLPRCPSCFFSNVFVLCVLHQYITCMGCCPVPRMQMWAPVLPLDAAKTHPKPDFSCCCNFLHRIFPGTCAAMRMQMCALVLPMDAVKTRIQTSAPGSAWDVGLLRNLHMVGACLMHASWHGTWGCYAACAWCVRHAWQLACMGGACLTAPCATCRQISPPGGSLTLGMHVGRMRADVAGGRGAGAVPRAGPHAGARLPRQRSAVGRLGAMHAARCCCKLAAKGTEAQLIMPDTTQGGADGASNRPSGSCACSPPCKLN